jgi:hypothetical protein
MPILGIPDSKLPMQAPISKLPDLSDLTAPIIILSPRTIILIILHTPNVHNVPSEIFHHTEAAIFFAIFQIALIKQLARLEIVQPAKAMQEIFDAMAKEPTAVCNIQRHIFDFAVPLTVLGYPGQLFHIPITF